MEQGTVAGRSPNYLPFYAGSVRQPSGGEGNHRA